MLGLLVLLVGGVVLAAPARAGEWRSQEGDVVRWPDGLAGLGRRVADLVPGVRRQVAERLGLPAVGAMVVIDVASGPEAASAAMGAPVPAWAAGVHGGGHIVLRSDLVDAGRPWRTLESVLRHEWVHLAWWRRAGLRARGLPRWFEEGLAEEIGGGISVDGGSELELAAAFDRLLPFADLTDRWPAEQFEAALAYRQSRSFVSWLVDRVGWAPLLEVLAHIAEGRAPPDMHPEEPLFEAWIAEVSKRRLSLWIPEWRDELVDMSRPWYHLFLRDLWGTLWLVMALVALLSFGFMRRRRRREIDALPDEDPGAGIVRGGGEERGGDAVSPGKEAGAN